MPILLENATVDGDGSIVDWSGNKPGTLQLSGVWGGATVTIYGKTQAEAEYQTPEENGAFTESEIIEFRMGTGKVKATVSGATGTTNLSAFVSPG
jgi:hypothetical protein